MADTLARTGVSAPTENSAALWGPYWISTGGSGTAVIIMADGGDDISFLRTTNGGASWAKTQIEGGSVAHVAAWFDQETPNDLGTLVHVLWMDSTLASEIVKYVSVDINTGVAGTIRTVDSSVTVHPSEHENRCGITKTRDNALIAAFLTGVEFKCYRSTDSFATAPTAIDDIFETAGQTDYILLFSANTGDNADCCALYWDRSENEITVKMYDQFLDNWVESTISGLGTMIDDTAHINMDAAVRHSDGFVLVAAHSDDEAVTNILKTFSVNPNSISSPPTSLEANIFASQGESAQVGLLINQQDNTVYVAYLKGNPLWAATVDVVYHINTNFELNSWGAEQAYSEAAPDDHRRVQAGRTVGDSGGFFQPCWYNNDSPFDIFVNLVNDVPIAAVSAGDPDIKGVIGSVGTVIGNESHIVAKIASRDTI